MSTNSEPLTHEDGLEFELSIEAVIRELEAEAVNPPSLNDDEWAQEGRRLTALDRQLLWDLGRWLNQGHGYYGDYVIEPTMGYAGTSFYSYASSITGKPAGHLKDIASTESRVRESVRTDQLSWSHHRVLINEFPDAADDELKVWLGKAVEDQLTVDDFRKVLREAKRSGGGAGSDSDRKPLNLTHSFVVTVPLRVWETLEKYAGGTEGSTPQLQAAEILTEYLDSPDAQDAARIHQAEAERRTFEARSANGKRSARNNDNLGLRRE